MKALVIGQGGREHALVRALRLSPSIEEVHALPGSDGIARDARCHAIDWRNFAAVADLAQREKIDFVVIGPEQPLVDGLADALRERGVPVVGPSREAARLEGSKIFCKDFLRAAGVPTARAEVVTSVEETRAAARAFSAPFVLKADGLAAGKGVFICKTEDELLAAARAIFVTKTLGEAGSKALLEEFQPGYELSYLILTNGHSYEPLPLAQDHKRLGDGDVGPNTGGMGVVAPVAIDPALLEKINREIIEPTVAHLGKLNFVYRGVLFVGLMITPSGPSVLEFNTRFGDPETQAILPLLDGDWGALLYELAQGRLSRKNWKSQSSCCVVLAAEGYPDDPVQGALISGLTQPLESETRYFLHAGTRRSADGQWVTSGGRVLNAVGVAPSLRQAVDQAYMQARQATWPGAQLRLDIGLAQL